MGIRQGVLIGVGIVMGVCGIGWAVLALMAGGATALARDATKDSGAEVQRINAEARAKHEAMEEKIRRTEAETPSGP